MRRILHALLAWLVAAGVGRTAFAAAEKAEAPPTTMVQRGLLRIVIPAKGVVVPSAEIPVQARMAGEIISAPIEVGLSVKKGQRLIELDPAPTSRTLQRAQADAREATARLQIARLECVLAEHEHQRLAGERRNRDALTASSLTCQIRRREVTALEAAVARAKVAVETVQNDFSKLVVVAPTSGVITECAIRRGQVIAPAMVQSGHPLLTLSDLSKIAVLIEIEEGQVREVQPNLAATVALSVFPEKRFPGRVASIAPVGLQRGGKVLFPVRINVEDDPGEAARPGLTAFVDIVAIEKSDALLLDVKAIRWVNAEPRVVVLEQGQAKERPVKIGRSDGTRCEILEGLREGDVAMLPPALPPPPPAKSGGK